jgi:uncharacterized protein (DUF1697 family)
MPKFVALLRGIGPGNPNMRNEKLRDAFEYLGFTNVQSVLSSGNIIFEYWMKSRSSLEWHIERILKEKLGLKIVAIVKGKGELENLVKENPFKGYTDTPSSRFNVTFIKNKKTENKDGESKGKGYQLLGSYDGTVCSLVDQTMKSTPAVMTHLEKKYGKEITTRTWATVNKILAKFE